MQRYGQKTSKIPSKWEFSPICDPLRFFFRVSLLYPFGDVTSCKKLEKKQWVVSKIFKDRLTDWLTDRQGRLLWTPSCNHGPKWTSYALSLIRYSQDDDIKTNPYLNPFHRCKKNSKCLAGHLGGHPSLAPYLSQITTWLASESLPRERSYLH